MPNHLIYIYVYVYYLYIIVSRGDLHTHLISHGPFLNNYHTRFIMGELISVLTYIHSLGLSYNDLKPENILITELGHCKVMLFIFYMNMEFCVI